MAKRRLLLDCDGVIFDSTRLIDKYVQKIEFRASDKYCELLNKMSADYHNQLHDLEIERSNNVEREANINSAIEEVRRLRKAHFLLKDMVLEEVLPKYKGLIDYARIFRLRNTFPGVIEKIKEICESGIFDEIFIVSHYNSPREAEVKIKFFREYLPMVKVILVKFHQDDFILGDDAKNSSRQRSNKIIEFSNQTGIVDHSHSSFIDDTLSIIEEAIEIGVGHCMHKGKRDKTVELLDKAFAFALYDANINEEDIIKDKRGK